MAAWACTACGGANPADTRFCGACGAPRAVAEVALLWGCELCGAGSAPEAQFCGQCGEPRAVDARRGDERRLVTALFADISGFTTLADRLEDAEALHDVIAPVITGLAAIAERYDGFIAKYAGDALLVFFGAPVAHEDDPARALLVALEMHASLPGLLAGLPEEAQGLEMHIGVNTGRVISGQFGGDLRSDYSILGDAVILAQRLESVAPSGSTYVGESTVALVGDAFTFESVGELELKGKLRAVPAWRLVDRRIVATATTTRLGPLVGRAAEVAAIEGLLDGLHQGRGGGLVVAVGEPGVGKSRLIAEARARADEGGVRWLQTRCLAYGAALPFWPFAELVRSTAGIGPGETPAVARARLTSAPGVEADTLPYLAEMIGAATEPGELPEDPEALRHGLHEAVTDWLVALGDRAPTVLTVEDVQWIDKASLALVGHLARVMYGWPLALVFTARPEGEETLAALTAGIEPGWVSRFDIGPLDHDAIVTYLTTLLEGEPPAELVTVVEERTGGNPLFVGELIRSLLEEKALETRNDRWRMRPGWVPTDVPDTVERVLAGRLDMLAVDQAALLQTASVIGRLVRLPLLRAVVDDGDLDERLEALVAAGFLDPSRDGLEPAYLFHHALVQDVAYERILRRNQRELHQRVAEVARELYGDDDDVIDLLARHAFLGGLPEASQYLRRAAERAERLFANDEAIAHLTRALEVVDATRRAELLVDLADLHNLVGSYDDALRLYREASPLASAATGEADVLRKLGDYQAALEVVDRALALVDPDSPEAAPLWQQRGWALFLGGGTVEAIPALERAIMLARPDDPVLPRALQVAAAACATEARPLDGLQYALYARWLLERAGDLRELCAVLRVAGEVYYGLERYDDAAAALRQALGLAQRTGDAQEVGGVLINLGMVELARDHLDDAVDCDRRAAAQFERIDNRTGQAIAYANIAEKLLYSGDLSGAEQYCALATAKAEDVGYRHTIADATATLALIRERQGDRDAANELAAMAAQGFREIGAERDAQRADGIAARTAPRVPTGETR